MEKVVVPKEIAVWLDESQSDVLCYEAAMIHFYYDDDELRKSVLKNYEVQGINQLCIFRYLYENADWEIARWMTEITNSFLVVSKALVEGYEIRGSIYDFF